MVRAYSFPCLAGLLAPLALLSAASLASPTPEQTAERYAAPAERSMMALSPNGEMIAFRSRENDEDRILVLSLTDNRLVSGLQLDDLDPHRLHFVSDEHLVMVASQNRRIPGYRGRHDVSTAYALDLDSGQAQQLLTPGDVIHKGQTGLGTIVGTSSDHQTIYMPALVADSRQDRSPDLALMAVDIDDPAGPEVIARGNRHTVNYFVDGRGQLRGRVQHNENKDRLSFWTLREDQWHEIYVNETAPELVHFLGMTEDRQSLLLLEENPDTGEEKYLKLDLDAEELTQLPLEHPGANIHSSYRDANRIARGFRLDGLSPRYAMFDESVDKRLKALREQLPDHSLTLHGMSEDRDKLLVRAEGNSTAGSYFLADAGEQLQFLTDTRPGLPEEAIQPSVQWRFEARDGLSIPTLLTLPRERADSPRNLPAVILPHGGPHASDQQGFAPLVQAMAAQGYAVIQPQFRGSTGLGQKHWDAGHGEWGRGMQDDLDDALAMLAEAGLVDPERVCIAGSSYGGYAALAGAAFTPGQYRCAIAIHGVSELNRMIEHDREEHGRDSWIVDYFSRSIARDYFTPERLAAHSPANFASGVEAPVLLIHGEEDRVVPIEQSELMRDRLEDADKPVEFLALEDTGHDYGEGEIRRTLFTEVLAFLDRQLGKPETE